MRRLVSVAVLSIEGNRGRSVDFDTLEKADEIKECGARTVAKSQSG